MNPSSQPGSGCRVRTCCRQRSRKPSCHVPHAYLKSCHGVGMPARPSRHQSMPKGGGGIHGVQT
eukprot:4479498-Pleurochrysis_carterae.AAC.1